MSAKDYRRTERVKLDPGVAGWIIELEIKNPTALDLDLYVSDPTMATQSTRGGRLCTSEGVYAVERCRVAPSPGELLVEIVVNGGEGKSDYVVRTRPLRGPRMEGTSLVGDDAVPLLPNSWTKAPGARGGELYALPKGGPWQVAVASDGGTALRLTVFDHKGVKAGQSSGADPYQELPGPPPDVGPGFVAVDLGGPATRGGVGYRVGVFSPDRPVSANVEGGSFTATGSTNQSFDLKVEPGQIAVIRLEGPTSRLTVQGPSGPIPTDGLFGATVQAVWVGEPVGNSRAVLGPTPVGQSLLIRVTTEEGRYQRSLSWGLAVRVFSGQPNYAVRFSASDVEIWDDDGSAGTLARKGSVPARGIRVLALPPPAPSSAGAKGPPPETRVVQLARLSETAIGLFDLAVCTGDGRVLDIGSASVRWEWTPELGGLFLVVFPDPGNPAQPGGPFEVQLLRSMPGEKRY